MCAKFPRDLLLPEKNDPHDCTSRMTKVKGNIRNRKLNIPGLRFGYTGFTFFRGKFLQSFPLVGEKLKLRGIWKSIPLEVCKGAALA